MLAPGSNFIKTLPFPMRESELTLFTPATRDKFKRKGAITFCSISWAEYPGILACTVTWGTSISGIRETGMFLMPIMPITMMATSIMVTAIGRFIK